MKLKITQSTRLVRVSTIGPELPDLVDFEDCETALATDYRLQEEDFDGLDKRLTPELNIFRPSQTF